MNHQQALFLKLTPTLSAWLLRSHWTLKSILREILFLDQFDFLLTSLNSFLQPFLKSKIPWHKKIPWHQKKFLFEAQFLKINRRNQSRRKKEMKILK